MYHVPASPTALDVLLSLVQFSHRSTREHRKSGVDNTADELRQLTALFRLLADPTRVNILLLLNKGEHSVNELVKAIKLPQPTISHHLSLLRNGNFVASERRGKQVFYVIAGNGFSKKGE